MKNAMNNYSAPEAEVISIEAEDVITTSNTGGITGGGGQTVGPWVDID